MFQYITVEEVLTPAVTKLDGLNRFVSLDKLRGAAEGLTRWFRWFHLNILKILLL